MGAADVLVAGLAEHQHGLVTVAQAADCGMSSQMRFDRIRSGALVRVDAQVLRIAGTQTTFHSRVMAAVLAAGPGALASHRTSAALRTFDDFRPGVLEVSIPRGRKFRRPSIVVHQSSDLDLAGADRIHGIPVTGAARTLLDVARRTTDARLFGAIESARRTKQTSWDDLVRTLLQHARQGRPGIQTLRRVITASIEREEITDSLLEALTLTLFAEHGLPAPVLHYRVHDGAGFFVAEVDLAFPELMIAIELDGEIHRSADVFHRDRPRQNALELLGWTVLRFTWLQVKDQPQLVVGQVRTALRSAANRRP